MEENAVQRIKVKLGDSEFEAEGPADIVQSQYRDFLAAFATSQQVKVSKTVPSLEPYADPSPKTNSSVVEDAPPGPSAVGTISDDLLSRVFRRQGDLVSLLAVPPGSDDKKQADALIVLLYGFTRIAGIAHVTGVTLMQAAQQSGVQVPRIDRAMNSRREYVLAAGTKRGRRYQLNNRGLRYAEDVIRNLVE